ncbi:hypothetical protein Tco_1498274, partial [Tanacetum coccineum]
PNHANLLPPRKRFRDSYSSGDSVEEDIEAAEAMNVKDGIDAVEIEMIRVIELAVANDIAEPTNEGYPDLVSVDGSREVMQLGLDVAMQELYDHMHKIPVDRITNIEVGQRYLEADGLIASGERERELVCLIMLRPWRGATRGFEAIEELINQRVAKALAAYEANHAAGLVVESESQNGNDGDNENGRGNGDGNGGGNGNGNGGGNENGNPNRNDRGAMPVARECTYHDFMKCQPLNFKGTKGVVGLTRWFEKIETIFHICVLESDKTERKCKESVYDSCS